MTWRLAWQVFTLEVRNLLNYRVDFWVNWLAGTLAQLGVAWFLWQAIFTAGDTQSMGGLSFKGMMLYYTIASVVDRAVQAGGRHTISNDIYEGSLNRYLVYPIAIFRYKIMENLAHAVFFTLQGLLLLFLFALFFGIPPEAQITIAGIAMGVTAVLAASVLYLAMAMTVEQVAFWADNVWSLAVLLAITTRLLGGTLIPLALFPEAVAKMLQWTPFGVMISLPIRCLMGQVGMQEWLLGMGLIAVWSGVFWALAAWVWKRGCLRYSGVGI